MLAIRFQSPVPHPIPILVHRGKAPDVHHPQVERGLPGHRPFGQYPTGPTARCNPERIEPGPHKHVGTFIRPAKDEIPVGRETFRSVDHLFDADIGQSGHPGNRLIHMLFKMVVVVVKQPEFPIVRHIPSHPRLRVGFIAAHHQPADFLFEIGAPVRIAQCGRVAGQTGNAVGDNVLVLDRLQRHGYPGHGPHLPRPLARAIDHRVAQDCALIGLHPGDAFAVHDKPGDPDAFVQAGPMHPCALGQRLGNVGRAGLPIGGQPGCADQVRGIHQRPHARHLGGRDQMHLHPERPRRGGQPLVFGPAVGGCGQPQTTGHFPTRLKPGLSCQ